MTPSFTAHCTALPSDTPPNNADLTTSIAELREIADGRNDVLAEAAGITAGSWYASPATHVGHELIAAGMLILAGGGRASRWTTPILNAGRGSGTNAAQKRGMENAEVCGP